MEKEQEEIQFLGFFGIFKESFIITFSWRKVFLQITLAIICPLSLIFLAHMQISQFLFEDIIHNEEASGYTHKSSYTYFNISNSISSDWTTFWTFKFTYFIFFLALSLLSTSAVVYTIACIYISKTITFKKVIRVVPKVWTRLMITFIWSFIVIFAYNVLALLVLSTEFTDITTLTRFPIFAILAAVYIMGFLYISIIWHLASVISVLEQDYGIEAMIKSKKLIKGKLIISLSIFLLLNLCFIAIQLGFQRCFVLGNYSLWSKLGFGIFCFFSQSILTLFGLIIQTVLYFVCKSYHHETIDKSWLADSLEVYDYLGDYVPLKSKDVLLEQFYV
ncbi:uncharacterized protein LOC111409512 [Olea europaea var. sylvestris]|uniref:Uncharacterized protein LOC111409512 n=1 Tax=Olea europaea subsp. europaea TaxID=158383 RepID=A0A8S0UJZ1_OLEEU|nr:uncharacterized protein LOC111409512 [Olea europaea var. sylvestris]CAA3015996.1 uncharacterized protein LOC111409512 [Olea europaea subsp. europaea]